MSWEGDCEGALWWGIIPKKENNMNDKKYFSAEEDNDYLFCNYSKEEISKLGQRFGDINLKNQW